MSDPRSDTIASLVRWCEERASALRRSLSTDEWVKMNDADHANHATALRLEACAQALRGSDAGPRDPTPDRLPEVERALEMFMAEVGEPYMASYRHAFDLRDGRNRATLAKYLCTVLALRAALPLPTTKEKP